MKALIINNLASGYREGSIYDFVRSFAQDGDELCIRSTDGTSPIEPMLADARDFDLVVAAGGDGTVTAVAYALANTGVPMLPYPAGTANLLSLNLQEPNEPHALAKLAREGKTLDFDVAEIEVAGIKHGFMIMAGAGYDATIMESAQPTKRLLGPMAYFLAAGTNIAPQHSKLTLTIDGVRHETEGLGVLIVNFSKIQFDISITHSNQPRDGVLDVVVLKGNNAFELLPALLAALMDRDGSNPDRTDAFEIYAGKEVTVNAEPALRVQFDGEVVSETTPFTARILPAASKLVLSDEGYSIFA